MPNPPIQILLIDDSPSDVFLLQEMLATVPAMLFALTVAPRLGEGLKHLGAQSFDVVLLDLGLPDSQGLATFVTVRDQAPGAPVVVLTGLADETLGVWAMQQGAQDYLIKGQVDGSGLARAIRY
ncbi:MAG: response regulator, partial [Chloroflexota bacterium]